MCVYINIYIYININIKKPTEIIYLTQRGRNCPSPAQGLVPLVPVPAGVRARAGGAAVPRGLPPPPRGAFGRGGSSRLFTLRLQPPGPPLPPGPPRSPAVLGFCRFPGLALVGFLVLFVLCCLSGADRVSRCSRGEGEAGGARPHRAIFFSSHAKNAAKEPSAPVPPSPRAPGTAQPSWRSLARGLRSATPLVFYSY